MPKVKEQANAKAKPTETAKGANAAEKAARLKVIESQVSVLSKTMVGMRDSLKKADSMQKAVCLKLIDIRDEHDLKPDEVRKLVVSSIAQVYCDGDESQVSANGNGTAYSLVSRIVRVATPKDKKAAAETEKGLNSDDYSFSDCVEFARANKTTKTTRKKGKLGGARTPGGNAVEDADSFGDLVSALIKRAWNGNGVVDGFEGGLDLDAIDEAFAGVMAGYRTKLEKAGDK